MERREEALFQEALDLSSKDFHKRKEKRGWRNGQGDRDKFKPSIVHFEANGKSLRWRPTFFHFRALPFFF